MKDTTTVKRLLLSAVLPAVLGAGLFSAPPLRAADVIATDAPAADTAPAAPTWSDFPSMFDGFLLGKVEPKEGRVDYLLLKGDKKLDRFIEAVAAADLSKFPKWTTKDKDGKEVVDRSVEIVFWINAFNAHVLKTVADAYPIASSHDIKDFATAKTHVVAGTAYSLGELREKIAKMDPRTVFALIDGTSGGPLLAPYAYRYAEIDGLLNATVSAFVNKEGNVVLDRPHNKVTLTGFFTQADPFFKQGSKRKKWEGIRYILSTYISRGADRGYFTTTDYVINFVPGDTRVNNKSLTGIHD